MDFITFCEKLGKNRIIESINNILTLGTFDMFSPLEHEQKYRKKILEQLKFGSF
jgi:hypothetical protein